jgi:hypothetical protein
MLILLAPVQLADAQQSKNIFRVGILFIGSRDQPHLAAFKQGLRERGYTEGRNIGSNTVMRKADMNAFPNSPVT